MANSFNLNNYALHLKVIRLTFLAICFLFYFLIISCSKTLQNQSFIAQNPNLTAENAININTATADELEKLPRIGKGIAKRIVEHRQKFGNFRRAEYLILVKGMSDKKFREIQTLIKVE